MVQAAKKAYGQSASLDCHLTQALVQRFMKGDDLSDDLLADVEKHLSVCAECMAVANGSTKPMSQRKEPNPVLAQTLAVLQQPKHLFMLGGLAIVLVLMGTVLRNPTAMLGPKVGVGKAEAEEKPEAKSETKTEDSDKSEKAEKAVKTDGAETKPTEVKEVAPAESHPSAEHAAESTTAKSVTTDTALSALQGLQSADPDLPQPTESTTTATTPKVNEGTVEQPPKRTDVIVVRESAPVVKAVRRAKPKAKAKPKQKPKHVAAPVKKETVKVAAPRRAAPKKPEVAVYDEHGRPVR